VASDIVTPVTPTVEKDLVAPSKTRATG